MNAMSGMIAVLVAAAVMVGRPAWAGDEAKATEARQLAAKTQPGAAQPLDRYSSARGTVITALGRLGSGPSLSVLESLQADNDGFVRHAVAEALLSAPPAEAITILAEMTADTGPAAWTLIRLGERAESTIIEILEEPTFRSSGPRNLIRQYYEHWKELPTPPSAAIVRAIHDRVQAEVGRGGHERYGREVLKLAGDPLVVRNAWRDLEAALSLMATKGQENRKNLLLGTRFPRFDQAPEEFLKDAEASNLRIRRIMADRTSALAHVADQKGEADYILRLNRTGVVWTISVVWAVPADNVQDRVNGFLKSHPQAKEVRADDALPKANR